MSNATLIFKILKLVETIADPERDNKEFQRALVTQRALGRRDQDEQEYAYIRGKLTNQYQQRAAVGNGRKRTVRKHKSYKI